MAHLIKYTRKQLPHILKHDSRAKDENGEYIKFGNKSIDTSRTHLNYNLHERKDGLSDYDFIVQQGKKYLAKNVVNRDNINWVGSWVITLPETLIKSDPEVHRRFFEQATKFLENRYGYDNIVGAYVHNDETTPHMHVKVLPVIYDRKKQKYRMSAKDMFDKRELSRFHGDLETHMTQVFGFDIGIRNRTVSKDEKASKRTIEELKQETAIMQRESQKIASDNELLKEMNKSLEKEVVSSKRELDNVKDELEDSKRMNAILQEEMNKRGLFGRNKAVADEVSLKMEMEISRRTSRQVEQMSASLENKRRELQRKERELVERESVLSQVANDYNDRFALAQKVEKLERQNEYLSDILRSLARNVFKLSKTVFKDAIRSFAESARNNLLTIAGISINNGDGRRQQRQDR